MTCPYCLQPPAGHGKLPLELCGKHKPTITALRETPKGVLVRTNSEIDVWTHVNGIRVTSVESLATVVRRARECGVAVIPTVQPVSTICFLLRCCSRDC